jgi:hypothetical protein
LKDYKISSKEDHQHKAVDRNKKTQPKLLDINKAHRKVCHISERVLKIRAQRDNLVLSGEFQPCSACFLYKATQIPVKKDTLMKATYAGEQIQFYVSGSFPPTMGGHIYWVMFKYQ